MKSYPVDKCVNCPNSVPTPLGVGKHTVWEFYCKISNKIINRPWELSEDCTLMDIVREE